jgi:hypothetical protein
MRRFGIMMATAFLALSLAPAVAGAHPAKAKLTVKPNTAITNGTSLSVRVVRERLTGARRPIDECTSDDKPPLLSTCTVVKKNSYTGADGSLRARVKAIVGPVGTVGGTCDADHSCVIVTFTTDGTKHPLTAPISFAASFASGPAGRMSS